MRNCTVNLNFSGKIYETEYQQSHIHQQEETIKSMQVQLDQANTIQGDMNSEFKSLQFKLDRAVQTNQTQSEVLENRYKTQQKQMESAYKQLRDKVKFCHDLLSLYQML
jgi:chromosome segregation ATPase